MGSKLLKNKNIPLIYLGIIIVIAFLIELGFSIESKVVDLILYIVVAIFAVLSIRSVSFQNIEGKRLAIISLIISVCLFILNEDIFLSIIVITTLSVFLVWLISKNESKKLRTIAFLFGVLSIGVNIIILNFYSPVVQDEYQRKDSPNKEFTLISRMEDTGSGAVEVVVQKKLYFVKWERRLYIGWESPKMSWTGKYEVSIKDRKINILTDYWDNTFR